MHMHEEYLASIITVCSGVWLLYGTVMLHVDPETAIMWPLM